MTDAVLKTVATQQLGRAGSIPVRLRQTWEQSEVGEDVPDPRRAVPRTDQVLADERLQAATTRLGPALVVSRRASSSALDRRSAISASTSALEERRMAT